MNGSGDETQAWGLSVPEFEARLRRSDAELLTAILATPVGWPHQQWEQAAQGQTKRGRRLGFGHVAREPVLVTRGATLAGDPAEAYAVM